MSKIKKRQDTLKVSKNAKYIPEKVKISFLYLTTNNKYNLKNEKNKKEICCSCLEKLFEITKCTWSELLERNKYNGLETISVSDLRFKPNGYDCYKDEKAFILRFGNQEYRLIGLKLNSKTKCKIYDIDCSVEDTTFYVIGFDVNYNAYNHGN